MPSHALRSATCESLHPGHRSVSFPTEWIWLRSTTYPHAEHSRPNAPSSLESSFCYFLGGCTSRKGLDLLAEAMGEVAPTHQELHLLIAGTDDGALSPFRDQMAELGLTRRITYLGHVAGEQARRVWAAADAFVLPSYSEGFSMAILEAMACRLPCLITTACHFPEAAAAGAAIVTSPDSAAVTQGLRELAGAYGCRTPPAR